jgi:acetyl-CoA carboxylase carboxyl transferase subunit alpha
MGITAERLGKFGLVDEIVKEPLGGAHRDPQAMADDLKAAILRHLREVEQLPEEQLLAKRYERQRAHGVFRAV